MLKNTHTHTHTRLRVHHSPFQSALVWNWHHWYGIHTVGPIIYYTLCTNSIPKPFWSRTPVLTPSRHDLVWKWDTKYSMNPIPVMPIPYQNFALKWIWYGKRWVWPIIYYTWWPFPHTKSCQDVLKPGFWIKISRFGMELGIMCPAVGIPCQRCEFERFAPPLPDNLCGKNCGSDALISTEDMSKNSRWRRSISTEEVSKNCPKNRGSGKWTP